MRLPNLDGLEPTRTYSAIDVAQAKLYSITGLTSGSHRIPIEVAGTKSASSKGLWIWVDAFDVTADSTTPVLMSVGFRTAIPGPVSPAFISMEFLSASSIRLPQNCSTQARAVVYAVSGLPFGTHTIVIEATGTKRTSAKGAWVWVDAFDYVGTN